MSGKPRTKSSGKSRGNPRQRIAHDTTERKGVEGQLKEAHERAIWLARLFEENPNPVIRVSADGTVLYCNPASAKLHGWKCKVGRVLRNELFSLINRAIVEGKEVQEDILLGKRFYIIWVMPLLAEGYVNIYGRDITARKGAEESLKKSEEEYRSLFEHMLDGFAYCQMVFDKDGHPEDFIYLAVNNAFEKLTGLKNVIGKRVTEVIPRIKELTPELFDIYGRVALTGKPERFEIDFKPLGLYLLVSVYSPAKSYFVAVFDDISERKRAEEELRKYRDELEMRIQERTEELVTMNEELKAENEERLRVELELRDSETRLRELSAALLNVQERERTLIAQEIHDSMGATLAASKFKVQSVINEMDDGNPHTKGVLESVIPLLQGTIEEARRIQMSLRPSMLDDLGILAAINWFCRQLESTYSNIHFKKEIDIQEDEVPQSLKIVIFRVLQEALNNAAKHSNASVVLLQLSRDDGAIRMVIDDNGKGFVLEDAYSRKGMAKGLGLDSMRERTELSGGFFSIESKQGVGTVIRATWSLDG